MGGGNLSSKLPKMEVGEKKEGGMGTKIKSKKWVSD
jgi:hypothetical protein